MEQQQAEETYTRLDNPERCKDLLTTLCDKGETHLVCIHQEQQPLPVVLHQVLPGDMLVLDLTTAPGVADMLEKMPASFVLSGRSGGTLLQTSPLYPRQRLEADGRIQISCDWPAWLEVLHRRSSFRAELNNSMKVDVNIRCQRYDRLFNAKLINLSLGGCLLELPALGEARHLVSGDILEKVELIFPNGQQVVLTSLICHAQLNINGKTMSLGCAFNDLDADLERRMWFFVREIERERARTTLDGDPSLAPSELFIPARKTGMQASDRQHGLDYATPMARRLARVAVYLNAQIQRLQKGGDIDSVQLSRHSEFLLELLDEDRESLLFASHCLIEDLPLIQHSIAVSVRLADLIMARNAPRELVKSVVACALVHDLGKALLPVSLLHVERMTLEQRQEFASHVSLIRMRMGACKWIPEGVMRGIIDGINERLDGSGYPLSLSGNQLGELARVAAVVDVIDAMSRARPDRPGQPVSGIYRYLIGREAQLDAQWCSRYIRHFGIIPIGALVRFSTGQLAWGQSLDAQGRIAGVHLTDSATLQGKTLGHTLSGPTLEALGRVDGIIVPKMGWV